GQDWTYNRAFADAHADTQMIYIIGSEDSEGYALHYRSEKVFSENAKQTSMRCVIVRGPGWQKDTCPAEDLLTTLWHTGDGRPSYEDCVTE
ncbi:MAG TPA: hypothetical protein PKK06_15300, partial [Phycisphaerae bacterium]|nr:hypothetical protein [Phycisphaerae bacterium]HNU46743.1 hypothetical protein [Phycisphaerae bacterium]